MAFGNCEYNQRKCDHVFEVSFCPDLSASYGVGIVEAITVL